MMHDFGAYRRRAFRYWERRRIFYNLALVPPAFFGYGLKDTFNWAGDQHDTHFAYIIPLFILSAIGANICYSFAYALEFILGSDDTSSRWLRGGRTTAFVAGILLAMVLAFFCAADIASVEWVHWHKFAD